MKTKQIVVVEDEPDIMEVLCYNLKLGSYQVFDSLEGREANTKNEYSNVSIV